MGWEIRRNFDDGKMAVVELVAPTSKRLFFGSTKHLGRPDHTNGQKVEVAIGPAISVPRIVGYLRFHDDAIQLGRWPAERVRDTSAQVFVAGQVVASLHPNASRVDDRLADEVAIHDDRFEIEIDTLGKRSAARFVIANEVESAPRLSHEAQHAIDTYGPGVLLTKENHRRCVGAILEQRLAGVLEPSNQQLAQRLGVGTTSIEKYLVEIATLLYIDDKSKGRARIISSALANSEEANNWINNLLAE